MVGQCSVLWGSAGQARLGGRCKAVFRGAWCSSVRSGLVRQAGPDAVWQGEVRSGPAGQAEHGRAGLGVVGPGLVGRVWHGLAVYGMATHGEVRYG